MPSRRSGVAADEQDGGDREYERAVADEERGARPRRQRMGAVREGEDLPANAAIPPAVFRTIAPIPSAKIPTSIR